ncbi:two-component system sensor histidine kinase DesK [Streptomyces sp. B4I13]|uniref:sensor histidine kinase n=1 Tax=Streptomyces sp. B4I13 TaxID=3042271 RepID=UPI0027874085|nr:sensor histidine kinase [Streptomyces sp. B4I13]MDQ0960772.1 two-component system sensor histidine kinase DesK [Streptomyces sp. B4I13]
MFGWIRRWHGRHWRERSKAERVELQSVLTWYVTTWSFSLFWLALPLVGEIDRRPLPLALGGSLLLVGALQCVETNRLTRSALDHYLGRAELPSRALRPAAVLLTLELALALALGALGGTDAVGVRLFVGAALLPFGLLYGLVAPVPVFLRRSAALAVVLMAAFAWISPAPAGIVAVGVLTAFGALFSLVVCRCGAWNLSVLWEAERAREVEARLAVAEERLRFGRDLHDVMGRNLAVIALKSELAVQLARRGRPDAVEQMIEVQRIAQESQREVRAVVRGYREADLGAELAGAQGVLEAAGIVCAVTGDAGALPAEVQSALGWVVRESTTNVLRHGDAERCSVALRRTDGYVVLTVENDGVRPDAPPGTQQGDTARDGTGRDDTARDGTSGHDTVRDGTGSGGAADRVPGSRTGSGGGMGSGKGTHSGSRTGPDVEGRGGSGLAGLRERLLRVDGTLQAGFVGTGGYRVVAQVPLNGKHAVKEVIS